MPSECVKVMVRVRPMNTKEKQAGCKDCVDVDTKACQIVLKKPNDATSEKMYTYDAVFVQNIAQQLVYEASAFPLVESVFEGYNGTIFAYGQTGCGKTHTMMGDPNSKEDKGIIPRTFSHIINVIESEKTKEFLVRVSFLEIYNEEIHDLLSKDAKAKYELKQSPEKGVFVKDLNQVVVKSVKEMEELMNRGNENRSVGATAMNKDSSRSHSIFTIYIETSEVDDMGRQNFRAGKLNLVDLAGSERQSKTQATGDRLKEANKINLSLSALGNVISALVDGKTHHIPYRDSKLTRLLEDSLGGNTKTIMIAAVSPADNSYDETSGTLRYASRAKNIKNAPKINEDPKDTLLKEYTEEIARLRQMLENQGNNGVQQGITNNGSNTTKQGKNRNRDNNDSRMKSIKEEMDVEKQKMQSEMQLKDERLEQERKQINELTEKLQQLEKQKLKGGASESVEEEQKKYLDLKRKMKKQTRIQEQLIEENKRNEENFLKQEQVFKSYQEEVATLRENNVRLRKRLKQALDEVNDMLSEAEGSKEELLEAVRTLERENTLNKAIIDILLTKKEYEIIRNHAVFDDDANAYKVPPFFLRNKEVRFPKLPHQQAMEQVKAEKETRVLEFDKTLKKNNNNNNLNNNNNNNDFEFEDSISSNSPLNESAHINNKNIMINIMQDETRKIPSRGRVRTRNTSTLQQSNISNSSSLNNEGTFRYQHNQKSSEKHPNQLQVPLSHQNRLSSDFFDGLQNIQPVANGQGASSHVSIASSSSNGNSAIGGGSHSQKKRNLTGIQLDPVLNGSTNSTIKQLIERQQQLPLSSGNTAVFNTTNSSFSQHRKNAPLKPLPSLSSNNNSANNGYFYQNAKNL